MGIYVPEEQTHGIGHGLQHLSLYGGVVEDSSHMGC
jgi:hypothetical protein